MTEGGIIKEALDAIQQRLSDGAAWLFAPFQWLIDWWPMMGHFAIFAAAILVGGFLARFLPDKAKLWLLMIFGFVGAFIAGEVNQYRKRLAAEKAIREAAKPKPKPKPAPPIDDQGARWNPFGKW